jgi:histidinol-phosphate aminotransferase
MSVIKKHITAMSAYKPPLEGRNPDAFTLLDFNERTIPVSEPIKKALRDYIESDRLQMYPSYGDIVERLAAYSGVLPEQLMITNGSDQGIDLIFRAVAEPGTQAIIPAPSFAMYDQCAKVEAMELIQPQYTPDAGYPLQEVLDAISSNTKIIVISNPNNPCGTMLPVDDVKVIARKAPQAAILVDECYFEYSQQSVCDAITALPNLFITRTFSKTWGIPSLRFAYLMSAQENIDALCNVRGPYDINQLAVVAATAALDNPEYTQAYVAEVMQEAKPLLESWLDEQGIMYWPSQANYVWCFPENAQLLGEHLQKQGFLVRPKAWNKRLGLRITVGTIEQTQKLIDSWF